MKLMMALPLNTAIRLVFISWLVWLGGCQSKPVESPSSSAAPWLRHFAWDTYQQQHRVWRLSGQRASQTGPQQFVIEQPRGIVYVQTGMWREIALQASQAWSQAGHVRLSNPARISANGLGGELQYSEWNPQTKSLTAKAIQLQFKGAKFQGTGLRWAYPYQQVVIDKVTASFRY